MKRKVLIVDDEEDLTWSIQKNLAKDKDQYDLVCVNDAEQALGVLSQLPIDLVVTDIKMPGMSGLDLLLKIKETYASTKVIIMTAYGSADVQKEATRRGSLYYIEKPFEIEELRDLIVGALKERKGFDGKVTDFQLSDLIQMNILGRMTAALVVTRSDERGVIYFDEGNVVHAECGDVTGEHAFYRVLTWDDGKFEFRKGERPQKETISKGWQSLLLEGLRRKDEITPETKTQLKEESRQESLERIKNILREFLKIKGVEFLTIVDSSGFSRASVVAEKKEPPLDITMFSNFIPQTFENCDKFGKEIQGDVLRQVTFEYGNRTVVLCPLPKRAEWLLFICLPDVNLGGVRMGIRKQAPILSELL